MNTNTLIEKIGRRWRRHTRLKRPVFLHIPKTGGTYLNQAETCWQQRKPVIDPLVSLGHATLLDHRQPVPPNYPPQGLGHEFSKDAASLRNKFVVTTVRNPFDWLVSYAGHAGGWTPRYRNTDHYDYDLANRDFGDLIRAIADRQDPWPSRRFLYMQAFSSSGALMVDWVCKNESLDDDLRQLASAKRLAYHQRPKQRVGKRRDYRSYYSDTLIDLVYQTWGRELALYGYHFDGPTSDGLLVGAVSKQVKQAVRYTWADDQLSIDPKVGWTANAPKPANHPLPQCA